MTGEKPMTRPRVKICCISSIVEAQAAIRSGAAAIGLVGQMPSGPGIISDDLICTIAQAVPPPIATFLLTSETTAAGIIAHYQKAHTSTIQLVDEVESSQYALIRAALPGVKLVQVIHVIDKGSVQQAKDISCHVDAILLDSGNPKLAVKELGGTGRTHNWEISRDIVRAVSVPVFLAGGLNSGNVRQAVQTVQPFGIDLCSSVRSDGHLDERKLKELFEALGG